MISLLLIKPLERLVATGHNRMDYELKQQIEAEEKIRHNARRAIEAKELAKEEAFERRSLHIERHGRFGAFVRVVLGWTIGWTIFVVFAISMDAGKYKWSAFWHQLPENLQMFSTGYIIFALVGAFRGFKYLG